MFINERYKQPLIDDLCHMIRIPSRSSPLGGEEGELQQFVANRMKDLGARVKTFEADDIPEFRKHPLCHGPDRRYKDRPTVIGELGPVDAPALLILAHSDTVQIMRPEDWQVDPFGGEIRDGKIYGLGSGDDKWGTATLLTVMRALRESGQTLHKRLIFASTIDEENGIGNGALLLMLAGIKAEAALYLDGFGMSVLIGNLGGSDLYLRPRKTKSPDQLSLHAQALQSACQAFRQRRTALFTQPFFADSARKDKSIVFQQRTDETGPFFIISFYTLPGEKRGVFCEELERLVSETLRDELSDYAMSYREPWFEHGIISEDTPLVKYLSTAIQDIVKKEPHITTITKQDRFVLTNYAHIPTVSFGPRSSYSDSPDTGRGGNHQPDECICIEELWQGCQIAYRTIGQWLEEI